MVSNKTQANLIDFSKDKKVQAFLEKLPGQISILRHMINDVIEGLKSIPYFLEVMNFSPKDVDLLASLFFVSISHMNEHLKGKCEDKNDQH